MSILASLFKRFTKKKPQPPIRRATEAMSSLSKILDGWEPQPDPEPSKPATSPERLAEIRKETPFWATAIDDPRFDLLYRDHRDHQILTLEDGWYVSNAIRPNIAMELTPETVAQAKLAAETFPIGPDGHHYCPPGFIIPPVK